MRWQELGDDGVRPREMEERLQKIMDEYAGGVSVFYELNEERLLAARKHLSKLHSQKQYHMFLDRYKRRYHHKLLQCYYIDL